MHEYEPSSPSPTPAPRGRRRLVLTAAATALALGSVGTGVAYAAIQHDGTTSSSASPAQGSTSQVFYPGYGYQTYGYGYDDQSGGGLQVPTSPYGTDGSGGTYGYGDSSGDGSGSSSSTDTTSQASGSQLTGLVRIDSTLKYDGGEAAGTGLVLTSDGEVVTNHHVVEGATSIKVKVMSTGATYIAKVVGTDATADVAVLQLEDASGLDTVSTDTSPVATGDSVTAVGDGNGTVDYLSAAPGTVMATDQSITTQAEGSDPAENLTGLIEISSDVVGGYSGGATYDADGQVAGMTTAASSGTSEIVGYAIPISTVLQVASDLESGATDADYTYGYPAFLGIGLGTGTVVQSVYDGTPASDAGIVAGDTITKIDGTSTPTTAKLRAAIAAHQPGDQISVTWTDTSGARHTATATLGDGPVA